jgi:hypothetical protein
MILPDYVSVGWVPAAHGKKNKGKPKIEFVRNDAERKIDVMADGRTG